MCLCVCKIYDNPVYINTGSPVRLVMSDSRPFHDYSAFILVSFRVCFVDIINNNNKIIGLSWERERESAHCRYRPTLKYLNSINDMISNMKTSRCLEVNCQSRRQSRLTLTCNTSRKVPCIRYTCVLRHTFPWQRGDHVNTSLNRVHQCNINLCAENTWRWRINPSVMYF